MLKSLIQKTIVLHIFDLGKVTLFENESIIDINYPDLLAPDLG